ncbi:MAG: biopolymer transporter ExbD [Alphaproteobacteria bacterium]|nr:biopolymer transporter ExbD [Alphaproteobacteria bacterium]MCY4317679.1 biopolymer transporter ExbD [Alphaproteobacteria bacterium]
MVAPLGGPGRRGRRYRPMSEINVTPLVDVMLVLLVVFMITAPLLTVGVPVDLPETEAAQLTENEEPLVVSIDAEGKVHIQETEVNLDGLPAKIRAIKDARRDPSVDVHVRGDRSIAYGRVMEIMGALEAAGFNVVVLRAELPDDRASP